MKMIFNRGQCIKVSITLFQPAEDGSASCFHKWRNRDVARWSNWGYRRIAIWGSWRNPDCSESKRKSAEGTQNTAQNCPHYLLAAPYSRTRLSPPDPFVRAISEVVRSNRPKNAEVCVAPFWIYSVWRIPDFVSMLFRIILSQMWGVTEVHPKLVEALSCLRHLAPFSQLFIFNMVLVCRVARNNKIHI